MLSWLDRVLYRHPFEGPSARRYAESERPAFGDLDERLLDALPALATAKRLLDVGCGPATFAHAALRRHPALHVIALDPSRDFARRSDARVHVVRASGEHVPLADRSIDLAICLSSIRHVRDREATLRELRRVASSLVIVELDPLADARRIAAHADRLGSRALRLAFGPLVVRTAPRAAQIIELAEHVGWTIRSLRDDAQQPVYIAECA